MTMTQTNDSFVKININNLKIIKKNTSYRYKNIQRLQRYL